MSGVQAYRFLAHHRNRTLHANPGRSAGNCFSIYSRDCPRSGYAPWAQILNMNLPAVSGTILAARSLDIAVRSIDVALRSGRIPLCLSSRCTTIFRIRLMP